MTIPCYPEQLHTALQQPPATLLTACRKATSLLSEVCFCDRAMKTQSMQAWQWEQMLPFFVSPEIIPAAALWIATAPCKRQGQPTLQRRSCSFPFLLRAQ